MTPVQLIARLESLQRALRMLMLGGMTVWVLGAMAVALLVTGVMRVAFGSPGAPLAWIFATAFAGCVGWWRWQRSRPDRLARVDAALWAETQVPTLRYALVTMAEQPRADDADAIQRRLATFSAGTPWEHATAAALQQRWIGTAGRLAIAALAVAVAGYPYPLRRASARAATPGTLVDSGVIAASRRVNATVTIIPPAYTGRSSSSPRFGQTIVALAGSVIRVDGDRYPAATALMVQESSDSGAGASRPVSITPRGSDGGWRGDVRIGTAPLALRFRDPLGERWLLVTPVADSAPVATILLPSADTLVFDTTATIAVAGTIHDDVALRDARVEYIISSGGGERFTFRSGVLAEQRGPLGRDVSLRAVLDLRALGLTSGDLMHVRLTAHDGNTRSGPTLGTSETRTIRIPRPDERDSVSVEQLPPTPVDKSVLSQRQLLIYTERLVARIPRIDRATMLQESMRIGNDQARLRKQVADIVFARLGDNPSGEHAHFPGDGHEHTAADLATQATPESVLKAADRATGGVSGMLDSHGDETPVVAVNRPLLEAYNAMWDASRALQGGVPREAIEPMKRALAAIQRARAAERVYLRGTPPAAVVDLARVRLIGTDSARFDARRALSALPAPERRLAERVLRSLTLVAARNPAAIDSLRLVRLDALGAAPALATALGAAIDALEQRRDATEPLLRARRVALARWSRAGGSALWLGGTP